MGVHDIRQQTRVAVRALKERVSLLDMRHQSADLPAPKQALLPFHRPPKIEEKKASEATTASPFSIEALIFAEFAQGNPAQDKPKKVPFLWELRGQSGRQEGQGQLVQQRMALAHRHQTYLIWTEKEVMLGRDEDLPWARQGLASIPKHIYEEEEAQENGPVPPQDVALIRGDVILEPYQVYQSHVLGADGFVCLPSLLSYDQMEEVLGYGGEVGLSALCLCFTEEDLLKANALGAKAIALSPGDPFGVLPLKSRLLLTAFEQQKTFVDGADVALFYAPRARAERLEEVAGVGATGLVASLRAFEIIAALRKT